MSLAQRFLFLIRTLLEEEEDPRSKRRSKRPSPRNRNGRRVQQTAALVITFRDIFATRGINFFLEDAESSRSFSRRPSKRRHGKSDTTRTSSFVYQPCRGGDLKSTNEGDLSWMVQDSVPLMHDERILSTPKMSLDPVKLARELDAYFEDRRLRGEHKNLLTDSLASESDNRSVSVLRRVVKGSKKLPKKKTTSTFFVTLNEDDRHREGSAEVILNNGSRVREEQEPKKKRKWRFLRPFC